MVIAKKESSKVFLGAEFLTWLYFYLEDQAYELTIEEGFPNPALAPADYKVQFAIGKKTNLAPLDSGAKVSISGPDLDQNAEILQALRRGALIQAIELQLAIGDRAYVFQLHSSDTGIRNLIFPDLFTEESDAVDASDVLELRMICLDEVEGILDALYQRFVTRRLAQAWQKEDLLSMRKKVSVGLAAQL